MFGNQVVAGVVAAPGNAPGPLDAAAVYAWGADLSRLDRAVSDAERIEQIRALEELKAAAAAAQARATADLDVSQCAAQAQAGVPAAKRGQGVGSQVALARRDSPARGGRHLGFAQALCREMPHTLAQLTSGVLSEWRATLLVRETAVLSREDRQTVDRLLAADPARLDDYGPLPTDVARALVDAALQDEGDSTSGAEVPGSPANDAEAAVRSVNRAKVAAWVRRLLTAPGTGELVGMDSHRRLFPDGLRRFITLRDQT